MIIDTGAQSSCLSRKAYDKLKQGIGRLHQSTLQYYTADGQKLQMFGETPNITVNWAGKEFQNKFLVLPYIAQADGLIGIDLLQKSEAQIDCTTNTVTINQINQTKVKEPQTKTTRPANWKIPEIPTDIAATHQHQIKQLLWDYADIMSQSDTDVGRTELIEHEIHTEGGPVRVPYRRANPMRREIEEKHIAEMEAAGIISESTSPYCAPLVITFRKDGRPRLCTDFRKLNEITKRDAKPMPRVDEVIETLVDSKVYATLDIKQAYWNIPIKEAHKEKTAFATSDGKLYHYNVMPFGLSNGSATCQRLMSLILKDLEWKICISYQDDVVVFANSMDQLIERLGTVFQRIREAKVKLNPQKCQIGLYEIGFLGHKIKAGELCPGDEKLEAIKNMKTPQSVRDTRCALGLFGYYRRFVENFSRIAEPLNQLLKKGRKWEWTTECETAFQTLKSKLTEHPITILPDFNKPFKLYVDGSHQGLGAILAQDKDGKERIIACASRSLTDGEKNYGATKLECLALVYGITHFRPYLEHAHFDVFTNHYSLKYHKNENYVSNIPALVDGTSEL